METADVAIIGAGVVGLATAYELARSGVAKIAVFEREALAGSGSTASCTGGIRLQFSSRPNIRLSLYGLQRFSTFQEQLGVDIALTRNGYLFLLARQSHCDLFRRGHELQKELGVQSEFVDPDEIEGIAPFLRLEDVICGSYCGSEAHADPGSVVQGYVKALREKGIQVRTNAEVTGITLKSQRITGVATNGGAVAAGAAVNCAGPFAGKIFDLAGIRLPLVPRKRHVLAVKPPFPVNHDLPLIIDMDTGWYLKPEAAGIALMGGTDREGTVSLEATPESERVDDIIQAAVHRAPMLEDAGIIRTIVGLRCMSPDDHALIGSVPGIEGFYCAVGFSGHGFMHAPAAGKALAEIILEGECRTFDMTAFDPSRFIGASFKTEAEAYVF
jgi:sarcosine oxidase subunit beta